MRTENINAKSQRREGKLRSGLNRETHEISNADFFISLILYGSQPEQADRSDSSNTLNPEMISPYFRQRKNLDGPSYGNRITVRCWIFVGAWVTGCQEGVCNDVAYSRTKPLPAQSTDSAGFVWDTE